jgi:hypothetical protein
MRPVRDRNPLAQGGRSVTKKRENAHLQDHDFTSANAPRTGRLKGARNRLSMRFLYELEQDFEKHGKLTIATCRIERPAEYLKIVASVLPKELEITDSRLRELSDEQLDALAEILGRSVGSARRPESREDPTLN